MRVKAIMAPVINKRGALGNRSVFPEVNGRSGAERPPGAQEARRNGQHHGGEGDPNGGQGREGKGNLEKITAAGKGSGWTHEDGEERRRKTGEGEFERKDGDELGPRGAIGLEHDGIIDTRRQAGGECAAQNDEAGQNGEAADTAYGKQEIAD